MYIYIYIYIILSDPPLSGGVFALAPSSAPSRSLITTINRIAIITTINRLAITNTINMIAIITTINRKAMIARPRPSRAPEARRERSGME